MKPSLIALFFVIPALAWGFKAEFFNITLHKTDLSPNTTQVPRYELTAGYHLKSFSKKDAYSVLFNTQKYMLDNNFFRDGAFRTSKALLTYKKAYIAGPKVYLFDVQGNIADAPVRAKKIEYDGKNHFILHRCEVREEKRIIRRNRYEMRE